jgi:hypothetical protein
MKSRSVGGHDRTFSSSPDQQPILLFGGDLKFPGRCLKRRFLIGCIHCPNKRRWRTFETVHIPLNGLLPNRLLRHAPQVRHFPVFARDRRNARRRYIFLRFGCKADIRLPSVDVRFTPKSGHRLSALGRFKGSFRRARETHRVRTGDSPNMTDPYPTASHPKRSRIRSIARSAVQRAIPR